MTDRELLESAAKSAGIGWDRDSEVWFGEPFVRHDWNPLTDDGDALRLAVKLSLLIAPDLGITLVGPEMGKGEVIEPHGDDAFAATRRAIVRAAVEMADRKPPNVRGKRQTTAATT